MTLSLILLIQLIFNGGPLLSKNYISNLIKGSEKCYLSVTIQNMILNIISACISSACWTYLQIALMAEFI